MSSHENNKGVFSTVQFGDNVFIVNVWCCTDFQACLCSHKRCLLA